MDIGDRARVARFEGKKEIICTKEEIKIFENETGFDLSKRTLFKVKLKICEF